MPPVPSLRIILVLVFLVFIGVRSSCRIDEAVSARLELLQCERIRPPEPNFAFQITTFMVSTEEVAKTNRCPVNETEVKQGWKKVLRSRGPNPT